MYVEHYFDLETGEGVWISGVKKRGSNRLFGSAIIRVDRRAVPQLLAELSEAQLDPARFVVGDAAETTTDRLAELHAKQNEAIARYDETDH